MLIDVNEAFLGSVKYLDEELHKKFLANPNDNNARQDWLIAFTLNAQIELAKLKDQRAKPSWVSRVLSSMKSNIENESEIV